VLPGRSRPLRLTGPVSLLLLGRPRLLSLVGLLSRALLERSGLPPFMRLLSRVLLSRVLLGRVLLGQCLQRLLGLLGLLLGRPRLGLMGPLRQVLLSGLWRLCGVLRSMCRPFGALRLLR
jgi:hypothetical protein